MVKTLVLIRHAHRDNSRRDLDNGLDDKGRDQAKALSRFYERRFEGESFKDGIWLVSSPKLRCRETLQPLAKVAGRTIDTHPDLDEQHSKEPFPEFEARVKRFLGEWSQSRAHLTLACGHGDWLPMAVFQLLGLRQTLKKGSWLELEVDSGQAELKWYLPSFKPFY